MLLQNGVTQVRRGIEAAAALGDERTQQIAGSLGDAAAAAVRLALIETATATAQEATAALLATEGLAPVEVSVQVDAEQTSVRVTALSDAPEPAGDPSGSDAAARISLRLSDSLKQDIEAAAAREGVSVNTWLVRAAQAGVQRPTAGRGRNGAQRISGWVTG